MALVINLGSQTSISIAGGDILQLPEVETLGNTNVSINVVGSAVLRPASSEKVNNISGDTALTEGKYLLFTTGSQNANWSLLSTSEGGGGVTNPLTENLDAGDYDITSVGALTATDVTISTSLTIGESGTNGEIYLYADLDDAERYEIMTTQTPEATVQLEINDPGDSVQFAFVDSAGGTDGQVPVWNQGPSIGGYFTLVDPGGGSGNVVLGPDVQTVSGDYQVLNADRWIIYNGTSDFDHTITLPTSPELGQIHYIKNNTSGTGIWVDTGDDTIRIPGLFGNQYPCGFICVNSGDSNIWQPLGQLYSEFYAPSVTSLTIQQYTSPYTYDIIPSVPGASRVITINDAGESTQFGLVSTDGGTTGQVPVWVESGVGHGGYLVFNESLDAGAKRMGVATVASGTVTVSTTAITANSLVFLTPRNASGVAVAEDFASRSAGNSFVIKAASDVDVVWMVVEP